MDESNGEPPAKRIKNGYISEKNGVGKINDFPKELPKSVKIGSRKSQLALFQANYVKDLLKKNHPEIKYEIITMATTGDKILNTPLSKIGQKSLFTKELEVALEANEVDVVVHSLKDLPTTLPEGMTIGAVCKRGNPFDAVVMSPKNSEQTLESLPEGSVIGTSSLRRIAQLKSKYPHLTFESVRGNLNTRFRKLDEDGTYEALILAAAGLERMDLSNRMSMVLPADICMYAVGQGALAVECKIQDLATLNLLSEINDRNTTLCCVAERAFMKKLEGGCSVPVAVNTVVEKDELSLCGGVFSLDGSRRIIESMKIVLNGSTEKTKRKHVDFAGITAQNVKQHFLAAAQRLGNDLATSLLKCGAGEILEEARSQNVKT